MGMLDWSSWASLGSDVFLLVMACFITLWDLWEPHPTRAGTYFLTLLTLAVSAVWSAIDLASHHTLYGWGGMVVSDGLSDFLKCAADVAMFLTVLYGRQTVIYHGLMRSGGEFFILTLFALLGIHTLIAGNHLLVLYLGLDLLTLSSYVLIAYRKDRGPALEAAMKYFVLGAMASGFLLYGLSLVYGATGSLHLPDIFKVISDGTVKEAVGVLGLVFIVAGLAFKLGLVPFHAWVPDAYQGASTSVTLFLSAAPKLAAFALLMRLLVDGLLPLALHWQPMLALLAVTSLIFGNVMAVVQNNLKRLLAYSTIAQMGFLALAWVPGVDLVHQTVLAANAYSSGLFYLLAYVLTTLPLLGVVLFLNQAGHDCESLADIQGLNERSPACAAVLAICFLSLAGIPPFLGFFAKLSVLQALLASTQTWHLGLALLAVLMSLVGAFYYLRVIKVMYFDEPVSNIPESDSRSQTAEQAAKWVEVEEVHKEKNSVVWFVLVLNVLALVVLGLFPQALMALCARVILQTLGT
jgi:NADH-quinone oxidoreductase subunit N